MLVVRIALAGMILNDGLMLRPYEHWIDPTRAFTATSLVRSSCGNAPDKGSQPDEHEASTENRRLDGTEGLAPLSQSGRAPRVNHWFDRTR